MNITCPLCGSNHSKRLVLTYAGGISKNRGYSIGFGGLVNLPTFVLFLASPILGPLIFPFFLFKAIQPLFVISHSRGISQSMLSVQSSPPYRFPVGAFLIFSFLFLVATTQTFAMLEVIRHMPMATYGGDWVNLIFFAVLALLSTILYLGIRYNRKKWPLLEAAWQRSFMCQRCGGIFLAVDYDPVGVNSVFSYKGWKKGSLLPESHTPEQKAAVEAKAEFDRKNIRKE